MDFLWKKRSWKYSTLLSFLNDKLDKKTNYLENMFKLECDIDTSIDDIRDIIRYSNLTNGKNEKTFIIFNDADFLNFQSWNALLKTIEEPPPDTIIVIILENLKFQKL